MRRYHSGEEIHYHTADEQYVRARVVHDDGGVSVEIGDRNIPRDCIYPDGAYDRAVAMLEERRERDLLAGCSLAVSEMLQSHEAPLIRVWRFGDAPRVLRDMSDNGGDEDWVAMVPKGMAADYIAWLESPAFGCCHIDEREWGDYRVYIGCHA